MPINNDILMQIRDELRGIKEALQSQPDPINKMVPVDEEEFVKSMNTDRPVRLMLGYADSNEPELLVEVDASYNPTSFDFYVVNGDWYGSVKDTTLTINMPSWCDGDEENTTREGVYIMSSNQDRLRGDYQTVFKKFDDPTYIAPPNGKWEWTDDRTPDQEFWDDDIPF